MKDKKHIMIIAGEPSGDLHGANLIKELINRNKANGVDDSFANHQSLTITGIGGDLMEDAGMRLFFHIKELSAMGVTEVLKQFKQIKQAFDLFRKKITLEKPDLLILIDYPGFNLKAAEYAKKNKIKVLYYITPKVWAWNSSRLKKIKKYVDHAAIIFPFEQTIFKKAEIPAIYVGNPLLDCYREVKREKELSKSPNNSDLLPPLTIGLLPGSRESEIANLLEIMLQSAIIINNLAKSVINNLNNIRFIVSAASSVNINKFNKILEPYNQVNINTQGDNIFEVVRGDPTEIFRRSDFLIATSGTVTLEAAICGVPMVIIYKTSPFTYFLAKKFVKIPYIGLPNIVANCPIVPELLQNDATPEKIAKHVLSMLNPEKLASTKKRLLMMKRYLGDAGAAERTAKLAIKMLES
ncbi:MAG: lipid-A-disaccharide synthase [Desulfamplus sp.]|nr:lipid-A-disaccharide synthase [Desulfamplus sp.]